MVWYQIDRRKIWIIKCIDVSKTKASYIADAGGAFLKINCLSEMYFVIHMRIHYLRKHFFAICPTWKMDLYRPSCFKIPLVLWYRWIFQILFPPNFLQNLRTLYEVSKFCCKKRFDQTKLWKNGAFSCGNMYIHVGMVRSPRGR